MSMIYSTMVPTVLAAYWIDDESLKYSVATVVCICGFIVTASFYGILSTAVDTFILCALVDYEKNDGSAARPHYMSDRIKEYVLSPVLRTWEIIKLKFWSDQVF